MITRHARTVRAKRKLERRGVHCISRRGQRQCKITPPPRCVDIPVRAETSPAPPSSDRREATVSRYEDWARHTDSWRWAGRAQAERRGEGGAREHGTHSSRRGAGAPFCSWKGNIMEMIDGPSWRGCQPASLGTSCRVSQSVGEGAKFERAKKEKAGPFWDREPLY